jgi:hypothetical protein
MAGGFQCNIVGLTDPANVPALSVISPNMRVMTSLGPVATLADVVQFPGPNVLGIWLVPAARCQISGIPAITATSAGMALMPSPTGLTPTGPMRINSPDPRAEGS